MPRIALPPKFPLLAMALCLFTGIAMSPVRSADAPAAKLVVQAATFGDLDNDKTVDVTKKVAAMVKDDNVNVVASADNFGDPAPKAAKKLRVGYTIDGVYGSKTVNQGETLDISAKLLIRKAIYGDLPSGPSADVTDQVAAMVQKNRLSVTASNDLFGDAAEGRVKRLRVDYTFDGKDKSKTVGENGTLTISNKGE